MAPRFANLNLTDSEKNILYMSEIMGERGSFGKIIQACKVDFIETNGYWTYKVYTRTGVIESKRKFNSHGIAENAAEKTIEYHYYVGH
jgi:hypothetical protein